MGHRPPPARQRSAPRDDLGSPAGFAEWVTRLRREGDGSAVVGCSSARVTMDSGRQRWCRAAKPCRKRFEPADDPARGTSDGCRASVKDRVGVAASHVTVLNDDCWLTPCHPASPWRRTRTPVPRSTCRYAPGRRRYWQTGSPAPTRAGGHATPSTFLIRSRVCPSPSRQDCWPPLSSPAYPMASVMTRSRSRLVQAPAMPGREWR